MEHAESLGAYALGALDEAEARTVREHLADCPDCRREVEEFVELKPGRDQVRREALMDGPPGDADLLLQRTLRQARAETPTGRRARWPVTVAAAAVAAIAAAGLAGGFLIGR